MGENCLADLLGRSVSLSQTERDALGRLVIGARQYRRGAVVRGERQPSSEIYLVQRGWLHCSLLLEDGRRQIIRLHFCGDLLGADTLALDEAADAIVALTDCEVALIDRDAIGRLFVDHPRLAALLFALQQIDRVMLMDRLVSLGRSSAQGRIAALLLWIANRLAQNDPATDGRFALPLTQEEIGDLTGLTAVHVNRTMRVLAEQGLITREAGKIYLPDKPRLAQIANFVERKARFDLGWLPPAR